MSQSPPLSLSWNTQISWKNSDLADQNVHWLILGRTVLLGSLRSLCIGYLPSATTVASIVFSSWWLPDYVLLCVLCAVLTHSVLSDSLWRHQAPLFRRFSRWEYWKGLPCPPPGDLPDPEIGSASLRSPALAGRFFTTSATWKARVGV